MKKQLTTAQMLGICLGDFARAILSGLIVTYTLKFFNVTPSSGLPLLIPAGMMGTLRGFGVFFDAITDPWVAGLSDNCKAKGGRRLPFMKWSAIPYALDFLPTSRRSKYNKYSMGSGNAPFILLVLNTL